MQGMLRIQDIIGLILAILIVAILISIILILRESARERKLWKEENEDSEEEPKIKRRLFTEKKINFPIRGKSAPPTAENELKEIEEKRQWQRIPREKELPQEEVKIKKEYVAPPETKIGFENQDIRHFETEEIYGKPEEEKVIPKIPLVDQKKPQEPRQAIIERGLKKLQEFNLDAKNLKINLSEETIDFSPLLWDIKEKIQSGEPLGDIVIHTVFKIIPGLSGEDVIEMYRSGDVSVVEKLEARLRSKEGREFLVASIYLSHFIIPELDRLLRNGTLSGEEYNLLKALKFVDRSTKKDFARAVYAQIVEGSEEDNV
ncbi:MAG: hypothetical protein KBG67_01195 [Candidatus Atribacteria bacterium]|nr:hypothetical protein [Candidatus Atribacteria bacterium]